MNTEDVYPNRYNRAFVIEVIKNVTRDFKGRDKEFKLSLVEFQNPNPSKVTLIKRDKENYIKLGENFNFEGYVVLDYSSKIRIYSEVLEEGEDQSLGVLCIEIVIPTQVEDLLDYHQDYSSFSLIFVSNIFYNKYLTKLDYANGRLTKAAR